MNNEYSSTSIKWAVGACLLAFVLLIGGCNFLSSYDAPGPGYAAVCQTGGPIEGDSGTCGVLPPGSGKTMIGYENKLVRFPSQQRFFRLGTGGDAAEVELPTADGVNTRISAQARFSLALDSKTLLDFYKKYGIRTYGGPKASDDPDKWWTTFLEAQFKPILESALREEISKYNCAELNPSCDLTKLNADLDKLSTNQDKSGGRLTTQRLTQISGEVTKKIKDDLRTELRGDFFRNLSFRLIKVTPPDNLLSEISEANAAKARLITARADARAKVEQARGTANAREQEARGRRALARAYNRNSSLAKIEIAKALCGPSGCQNLQVLGANSGLLTQVGK